MTLSSLWIWVRHKITGQVWCDTCREWYGAGSAHSWGAKRGRTYG